MRYVDPNDLWHGDEHLIDEGEVISEERQIFEDNLLEWDFDDLYINDLVEVGLFNEYF